MAAAISAVMSTKHCQARNLQREARKKTNNDLKEQEEEGNILCSACGIHKGSHSIKTFVASTEDEKQKLDKYLKMTEDEKNKLDKYLQATEDEKNKLDKYLQDLRSNTQPSPAPASPAATATVEKSHGQNVRKPLPPICSPEPEPELLPSVVVE